MVEKHDFLRKMPQVRQAASRSDYVLAAHPHSVPRRRRPSSSSAAEVVEKALVQGAGVHDIEHDRAFASEDITTVTVHFVVETRDFAHIQRLRERLEREGYASSVP